MNLRQIFINAVAGVCALSASAGGGYPITPVEFTAVKVSDSGMWADRLRACRTVTIPLAFSKCESEGRYRNFVRAAHPCDTFSISGFSFDDTDVYKTIEGASYSLQTHPDPALEAYIDSVLEVVAAAQEPDGYLYTARTMNPGHPHAWAGSERWVKVEDLSHEFYNLGHMVDGAVAHYQATGKRNFLDIAIRYADCVCKAIGPDPGQLKLVPGHQIAEMALARLYLVTGDEKYLRQAKFFLDMRGHTSRKGSYSQAHMPVVEQDEAVGHAVRAAYMYAGMADVAALTGDSAYIAAIDRIWDNIVSRKLYITGGIGATSNGEAFGANYELPNHTAYCETCAAIGNVYVNHRLFLLHGHAKYYDVLERTLYNGLISGMSMDGGRFFYPNPLESHGDHDRQAWFGCACCPSNLCRFIPSVPGYIYASHDNSLYINLFIPGSMATTVGGKQVKISQHTDYPSSGKVLVNIDDNRAGSFDIKLRIPGWAQNRPLPSDLYEYVDGHAGSYSVKVNGKSVDASVGSDGYMTISRNWRKGDRVELTLDMTPRVVRAHHNVKADRGRLAVERGPIVYCAEWADNPGKEVLTASISSTSSIQPAQGDMPSTLIVDGEWKLIPYYAWNHRGKGNMAVWLKDAEADEAASVRDIIAKVNGYWQSTQPAEKRAFWDNAAYHTGNMEAYRLTGNEKYREYSERWAEHNQWKGAKSNDRSQWKWSYGEKDDYVLFGDWQICFQTYADLYNIHPDDKRIRRAREVMEYEMSTPRNDYWWWADGLYMVMPVMTKLYNITGNEKYLDKLHEYFLYADSIMYDHDEHLYYRDAKYTWPKHKSANGKKDFWARGDGWVLAGLAKVLADLPADYRYRKLFLDRYMAMADAVVASQQPEGYWTRSMLDAEHAPGPETSGTAFFTYGLLWGINHGYLTDAKYKDAAMCGWKYLRDVALQPDGRVGYVQPIGEKAIPGQVIDAQSTASFGVGAYLLAACEYVRYLESAANHDRTYWVNMAYKLAYPVLSNMSRGELQKNMQVEVSPTWDGRNIRVTYMEAFGRLMAGIAPWLSLPDDDTAEGVKRGELRRMALEAYRHAVDPDSPDCLLWQGEGQALVDAAYVAESFLRAFDALWMPLDDVTKQRYIECFQSLRRIDPPYTNWVLFSSTVESFLAKAGAKADIYRVNSAIRKVEEWYTGDGWYADGPDFAFDYYSSYVFHPMYLETLQAMKHSGQNHRIDYGRYYSRALQRARKHSLVLERMISPEGTFPVVGRSIPYRMAAMQPLALMAWYGKLPHGITPAQARCALTAVMHRMYDGRDNFNEGGFLTIGFTGRQPGIADWYTNNGSLYMTSLSLLPLGLPASHPFWTDAACEWTQCKAWNGKPFPKDHRWADGTAIRDKF